MVKKKSWIKKRAKAKFKKWSFPIRNSLGMKRRGEIAMWIGIYEEHDYHSPTSHIKVGHTPFCALSYITWVQDTTCASWIWCVMTGTKDTENSTTLKVYNTMLLRFDILEMLPPLSQVWFYFNFWSFLSSSLNESLFYYSVCKSLCSLALTAQPI